MATGKRIVDFPDASSLTGTEYIPIWQSNGTRRMQPEDLAALGVQGEQGEKGDEGDPGPAGTDGNRILSGAGAPSGGLGSNDDYYLDTAVTRLYGPKTGGSWGPGVSLLGLPGTNGTDGTDGTDGADGADGVGVPVGGTTGQVLAKASNTNYDTNWVAAQSGPAGEDGADGRTILSGAADPTGGQGANGDFYINVTSHTIFGPKTAGAWGSGTSLVGPAGDDGDPGADGTDGSDGADGKTIRNGTGVPGGGLGVDGDYYIDNTGHLLYGPKTSGAWGSGFSLVGPAGVDGKTVRHGTGAPAGGLGVDGDFYIDTAATAIYGPKASGAWGSATSLIGAAGSAGQGVPTGGTSGQVLQKASATNYDTIWATPSAGGSLTVAPAMVKIASVTLAANASTIDFSSIPSTYQSLMIVASLRGTSGNAADIVRLRLNAIDSAGGYMYMWHQLMTTTTSPTVTSSNSADHIPVGHMRGIANSDHAFIELKIGHYALAHSPGLTNRAVQSRATLMQQTTVANWVQGIYNGSYMWDNQPINQVTLSPAAGQFAPPSTAVLYGIGEANVTGVTDTKALVTKTASYTANDTDYAIFCDTTSGAITISLPTAVGRTGRAFEIKDWKGTAATNNVTIDPNGTETIDGATTKVLNAPYASLTIRADGTNWGIV